MEQGFEYYAFISYKREDEKWAKWLQKRIENYRLPAIIRKSDSILPIKLRPVFLDQTDIQPGLLKDELSQQLENSRYLIVICSPMSAKSEWVGEEISQFIALGRADRIIPFIIEGEPYSNNSETECFHPVLKEELPELLGVNINEKGKEHRLIKREKAVIRLLSKMLAVSFDSLWKRQRRRRIRQTISLTILVITMLATLAATWKYNQPFNTQLSIRETTFHNENLGVPERGGTITVFYPDGDSLVKTFKNLEDMIYFNNVPGHYHNIKSKVCFRLWGFEETDTVMALSQRMILSVKRDNTYSKVHGYVRNALTDIFMEGITVQVANQSTVTDSNGYFVLEIPLEKQQKSYEAILIGNSKKGEPQTVYPTQKKESLTNTLYFE